LLVDEENISISNDALMFRLFPRCDRSQCFTNGWYRSRWYRAAMAIHPEAIPYLREAKPPLRSLLDPEVPEGRRRVNVRQSKHGDPHLTVGGIPLYETPERTRDEQIAWCLELQDAS